MRGYNFDPVLLLESFSARSEKKDDNSNVVTPPINKEVVHEADAPPEKESVILTSTSIHSSSKGITPTTACLIAFGLLLIVFLIMIIDSRKRINRLENVLFRMLQTR